MNDPKRRRFLQISASLSGAAVLPGCGGGGSQAAAPVPVADPPAPAPTPVPTPPPPPPAPAPVPTPTPPPPAPAPISTALAGLFTGAMQFSLLSPTTQAKAPFCLGFACRAGDVPAGTSLVSRVGSLQVTARSTWPDGSLRIAQLAGFADLAADIPLTMRLAAAASAPGPSALTIADLKATGVTAEVDAASLGKAGFAGADWDAPFQTWVSGALMSSWVFRKPVGSDAHLVAWLEVRLFAGGAVEVLPWIENGYLRVAGPTNKSAIYSFTLGGRQRFSGAIDLPHHCRTPLINGAMLSHWLGADPLVTPRQDAAYLQASELVPTYTARIAADSVIAKALATSFAPLQKANFNYDGDSMPASGYQDPIGLLPQHDVLYLVCDNDNGYAAVVRNGFAAGRYPIHYRDETTQRPLRFSQYPNLVLNDASRVRDIGGSTASQVTPLPSGTPSPVWDCAHSPSVAYMAYLATGRWYFMEQLQFAATLDYLGKGDHPVLRRGALGLVQPCYGAWQTRSCAWQWRTLVQALSVTPDSDAVLRQELIACVQNNIDNMHATYVAQANNPFGWVQPGEGYDQTEMLFGACWQQDFVTAAFGYSLSLGLPVSTAAASKLATFFQWKARSAVMRLGPADAFWYVNGAPYVMSITPSILPDFAGGKGPWRADDAAVYAATYASKPTWLGSTEGTLAAEALPGERSMWGNLNMAMAYCVRHGAPGAVAAYQRMTRASNYSALRDNFNVRPVWAGAPARITPAWLAGKPLNEWFEIPNTSGAGGAAVDAYSGIAINEASLDILIAAAGGHGDSSDNRVVSLNLGADAPGWTVRMAPSATVAENVAYYADGKPSSRHLYSSLQFVPGVNRLMLFGAYAVFGAAYAFPKVDAFNLDTNKWDPAGTWPDIQIGYAATQIRATGQVISTALNQWSAKDQTWRPLVTQSNGDGARWPMAYDSRRGQLYCLQWGDGQGYDPMRMVSNRITVPGGQQIAVSFTASAALTQWLAEKPAYAGMDYDPDQDRFLFYAGQDAAAGRVYVVKPNETNVWDMSLLVTTANSVKIAPSSSGGLQNRLRYVPALRGFVLMARASANLYFLRTA